MRKNMTFLISAALMAGLFAFTPMKASAQGGDVSGQIIPSLELNEADVREALKILFRSVNVSYSIAPDVQGTITLSLKNVPFETALRNITNQVDATYRVEGGVYQIIRREEVGRKHRIPLEGRSIGVIGVGNVGSRVARKCEVLGMRVLRNDPPLQRRTRDPKYVPIESLYGCDFLTIHTPLTHEGIDKTFDAVVFGRFLRFFWLFRFLGRRIVRVGDFLNFGRDVHAEHILGEIEQIAGQVGTDEVRHGVGASDAIRGQPFDGAPPFGA